MTMEKKTFAVNGMKCGHCVASVEGALKALPGVTMAKANLDEKNVTVEYDEAQVKPEALKEAVDGAGRFELVL